MTQDNHPTPLSFVLDEEGCEVSFSWSDGHESMHHWEQLRWACPCAWCAGEAGMPGMLQQKKSLTREETTLVNIQPVGRYGVTPIWEDGHRTGIFTHERLRALCECEDCKRKNFGKK